MASKAGDSASFAAYLVRKDHVAKAADRFAADVRRLGFQVDRDVATEGFRFDLAVRSSSGGSVLIDFLASDRPRTYQFRRADYAARAFMIRELTKAEVIYVLVPSAEQQAQAAVQAPFVWLPDALARARELLESATPSSSRRLVANADEVFVAMPFSSSHGPTRYSDVYNLAIRQAARAVGLGAFRVDYAGDWTDVVQDIRSHIESSLFTIADVSENKPNVLYEIGYAHAVGRTTVLIRCGDEDRPPFDIAHHKIHSYDIHDTVALTTYLRRAFREVLRQHGRIPPDRRRRENRTAPLTAGFRPS